MLHIAEKTFTSHLLLGSAGYPDSKTMQKAIQASGAEIVTVSIRRLNIQSSERQGILNDLYALNVLLLPNTAGCYTAQEAILTAELAREALNTTWIKLEVVGDERFLLPDTEELVKAAIELVKRGFTVLPYCTDDLITCKKLVDCGCAAVMPLASPIGSGRGISNPYALQILREEIAIPIIVDAGIGTASDVTICMELGIDGVLIDTAIAQAQHPVKMAEAMRHATIAGQEAYLAGRIPIKAYAQGSSPTHGVVQCAL